MPGFRRSGHICWLEKPSRSTIFLVKLDGDASSGVSFITYVSSNDIPAQWTGQDSRSGVSSGLTAVLIHSSMH